MKNGSRDHRFNSGDDRSSPAAITARVLERCRQTAGVSVRATAHPEGLPMLSADWRFENFTHSLENQDAIAFALLASFQNRPERVPLIIFGPSGSGKSHLLHAIGWNWARFNAASGGRLLFVNAKQFMADETMGEQISALRKGDCLLFDDLEVLKDSDLIYLADLVGGLIGQDTGLVFGWRGERKGIAKAACHYFPGFQNLCLAELAGRLAP